MTADIDHDRSPTTRILRKWQEKRDHDAATHIRDSLARINNCADDLADCLSRLSTKPISPRVRRMIESDLLDALGSMRLAQSDMVESRHLIRDVLVTHPLLVQLVDPDDSIST